VSVQYEMQDERKCQQNVSHRKVSVKKGDSLSVSVSKKARCKMEDGRARE